MFEGPSLKELHHEPYLCPGPSKPPAFGGASAEVGESMSYFRCLAFPDCTCERYRQQVDKIEALEARMELS